MFARGLAESESAQFGRDARADWRVICFTFIFLNLVSIGVSVFVYGKINKGEIFLVDKSEQVSVKTLGRFELEQTVHYFNEKQDRFDALLQRGLPTVDPYIPRAVPKR